MYADAGSLLASEARAYQLENLPLTLILSRGYVVIFIHALGGVAPLRARVARLASLAYAPLLLVDAPLLGRIPARAALLSSR